jgi:hypothetical protein
MLHRFAFEGGHVRYTNRFLQSRAYRKAIAQNTIAYDEFATNRTGPVWSRLFARLTGKPTDNGNVNVLSYGDHDIVALTETPAPLRVDPKTLATLGPFEWTDGLNSEVTTAHPHYDTTRRLIYNFEIAFGRKTLYRFTRMGLGSRSRSVVAEIETSEPANTHSFAMSERYLILAECPLVTTPLRLLFSGRPFVAYPDARIIDALYLEELRAGKAVPQGFLTRFTIPLGECAVTQNVLASTALELPRMAYRRCVPGAAIAMCGARANRAQDFWTVSSSRISKPRRPRTGARKTPFPASRCSCPRQTPGPRMRAFFCRCGARRRRGALFPSRSRCRDHAGVRASLCAACHPFRLSRKLFSKRRLVATPFAAPISSHEREVLEDQFSVVPMLFPPYTAHRARKTDDQMDAPVFYVMGRVARATRGDGRCWW